MIKCKQTPFEQVSDYLGELKSELMYLSPSIKSSVQEIRLRVGKPISLQIKDRTLSISERKVTKKEIDDCFLRICRYSVHSFGNQIAQGFITLRGGHRVGICGTAVMGNEKVTGIKDVSSVNIRIAKENIGCADELMHRIFGQGLKSIIIAGEPISGKTTILRDLARQIGEKHKACIIDERSEIAAVYNGEPQLDIGIYTDVFNSFPKEIGIMTALRSMSPEIIICDEIGNSVSPLVECMNMGVKIIVTAHCASFEELFNRKATRDLIASGAFEKAVLLGSKKNIGKILGIWNITRGGISNADEIDWCNFSDGDGIAYGYENFL
ncbi:MAG: stage III sporulation protein AA [Clostridiales bacterium]|nr:stage III sporulation protein AA [Clostridiales bacterium]